MTANSRTGREFRVEWVRPQYVTHPLGT